jgi:hypothetical protein
MAATLLETGGCRTAPTAMRLDRVREEVAVRLDNDFVKQSPQSLLFDILGLQTRNIRKAHGVLIFEMWDVKSLMMVGSISSRDF